MKKTRKIRLSITWIAIFGALLCSCEKSLDIRQDYPFDVTTKPVPDKIMPDETVEIQCQLIREGIYDDARYCIRYFQSKGSGELKLSSGITLIPNEEYLLESGSNFHLYYTSKCTEQQDISVYISDNFGKTVELSFSFQNVDTPTEEPVDYSFTFTTLPVPARICLNDTIEIRCRLTKEDQRNDAFCAVRYFQTSGQGKLLFGKEVSMQSNELYHLDADIFSLYYVSNSEERHSIDIYIVDSRGQTVQKSFNFENIPIEPEPEIDFTFMFETLPIPSQILLNDTIEIRCQLTKADERNDATHAIRYFQTSGRGKLLLEKNVSMQPNELYNLESETFRLYYVSNSEERHSIDIYIVDSQGKTVQKSFNFENIPITPEPEIDISFAFETLPVPKAITTGETVEIRCILKKTDERNTANYRIRYFQPDGYGILKLSSGTILVPNDLYSLTSQTFRLYYTSNCEEAQVVDIYIEDSFGQVIQKTFNFQHRVMKENVEES